jgi:hypothetical protein
MPPEPSFATVKGIGGEDYAGNGSRRE